jgi:hypothetical protein
MELLWDFAYQLPTLVMCDMLGLEDTADADNMARLTRAVAQSFIVFETRRLTGHAGCRFADGLPEQFFGAVYDRKKPTRRMT